jgi:outer membrane protein assembly factor BamE (lipoprotein component of BamABCDE complex)
MIMSMLKPIRVAAVRISFVFVLVLLLLIEVSCSENRLRKANVDQVVEGMSKKQVESILGPPTDIDNTDFIIMKKTTYVYRQDNGTVTIVFKDDKVSDKYSNLPR